jgi:hypothetical protein
MSVDHSRQSAAIRHCFAAGGGRWTADGQYERKDKSQRTLD